MRTQWEHGRKPKIPLPPTSPKKEKNWTLEECMFEPSHWLHETFISKVVCHQFWPGLIAKGHKLWDIVG